MLTWIKQELGLSREFNPECFKIQNWFYGLMTIDYQPIEKMKQLTKL
jgi:hypothetical protein